MAHTEIVRTLAERSIEKVNTELPEILQQFYGANAAWNPWRPPVYLEIASSEAVNALIAGELWREKRLDEAITDYSNRTIRGRLHDVYVLPVNSTNPGTDDERALEDARSSIDVSAVELCKVLVNFRPYKGIFYATHRIRNLFQDYAPEVAIRANQSQSIYGGWIAEERGNAESFKQRRKAITSQARYAVGQVQFEAMQRLAARATLSSER